MVQISKDLRSVDHPIFFLQNPSEKVLLNSLQISLPNSKDCFGIFGDQGDHIKHPKYIKILVSLLGFA